MIEETLEGIGLTEEETEIYLSLINNGAQGASSLSQTTKVKRTYVYKICKELMKKGLVAQTAQGSATVFSPNSPDYLLSLAEKRKQEAETHERQLESILNTLKTKYSAIDTRPVVSFYEGVEGVKKVYLDTLNQKETIDALVETTKVDPEIYKWVTSIYGPKRVMAGIPVRAIVASGAKTHQYISKNEDELRETKSISSSNFPFEHEVNIYGTKVAIINHRDKTKLFGVIIDNKLVAQTFKSWFELTWEKLV